MIRRHYRPGSFLRVDDRTGFTVYAENTRKEWTGNIVRTQSWEPRQPQDFVRGVADPQTVPDPRARQAPEFVSVGVGLFYLTRNLYPAAPQSVFSAAFNSGFLHRQSYAPSGAIMYIDSTAGIDVGDTLKITLDTGDYQNVKVILVENDRIGYFPRVVSNASAGNAVFDITDQITIPTSGDFFEVDFTDDFS